MKILYHHRTASKDGQAVHIEELIAALRSQGHEVRIVAPGDASAGDGTMGDDMGWVHRLKASLPKAAYELMELAYSWLAYRKLLAAAREFQPDVLYERYNLFLLAGLMASQRLRIPLLLEVNAPLVNERARHSGGLALESLARWAERKAWAGADVVLPVTDVLADHVRAYGVTDERIAVIPNGINEAHFQHAPHPDAAKQQLGLQGRLVLGFTGFVRDWHGVDRVIAWMSGDQAPKNSHLLIVGDGPARVDLEAQARQLGLAERVTFTGVVHRDRVPLHVAAFDVALQPAVVAYASPLKLMEYLVLGKAIIAPRAPNLLEVLEDGCNAQLFDAAEPGGLEASLARVCSDDGLRARLGEGASATIARLGLTWQSNAQRVVALAQRSMAGQGR
jgi:glycosyltransferase involved in cell wall biosynthesis